MGKHPKEIQSEIIQGHLQFGPKLKEHNKIKYCIDKVLSSKNVTSFPIFFYLRFHKLPEGGEDSYVVNKTRVAAMYGLSGGT